MDLGASPPAAVTSDEFRHVIGYFMSGVTVITAAHEGARFGATASAMSSLSLEPPMLLVCINAEAATAKAITAARAFAVNILGEGQDGLAVRFASRAPDKFGEVPVTQSDDGVPLLADAVANIECQVVNQVRGGTHIVFVSEVVRVQARGGNPLAYFRGRFGRLSLPDEGEDPRLRHDLLDLDWVAA